MKNLLNWRSYGLRKMTNKIFFSLAVICTGYENGCYWNLIDCYVYRLWSEFNKQIRLKDRFHIHTGKQFLNDNERLSERNLFTPYNERINYVKILLNRFCTNWQNGRNETMIGRIDREYLYELWRKVEIKKSFLI